MDNNNPPYVSSRKRVRSNDSEDERNHESDGEDVNKPDWNLVWPRFIVLESLDQSEPLTKLSPFAVEKAIQGRFGTVKKVSKLRSGSLLIEAARPTQAKMILDTTLLLNIEVKATAHRSLNTSKGVIRDYGRDLFEMSETEIVTEMADQGVQNVSRFILKKDGKEIKTNTYFITFGMSAPPEKLRIGYYFVEVKRYIPNPLRCFQCQEFGHSKKFCKIQLKFGNADAKATMAVSATQRLFVVSIVRANTFRHLELAPCGPLKRRSSVLKQRSLFHMARPDDSLQRRRLPRQLLHRMPTQFEQQQIQSDLSSVRLLTSGCQTTHLSRSLLRNLLF